MRRRDFITLLGGAAAAWPFAARAQQTDRLRRVGILMPYPKGDSETEARIRVFKQELAKLGWADGRNIRFDEHWTTDNMDMVRAQAAAVVASNPDIIVTTGGRVTPVFMRLTRSIPMVLPSASDPVGVGWAQSLAHPGGNVTGFTGFELSMLGKSLEILKQIAPAVVRVALIYNPDNPNSVHYRRISEAASAPLAIEVIDHPIHGLADIDRAVTNLADRGNGGIFLSARPHDQRAARRRRWPGRAAPRASDLFGAVLREARRPGVLRGRSLGGVPPLGRLCRSHFARRETRRSAVPAADQIRTHTQPHSRQGARPRIVARAAGARRRGDRVKRREFITLLGGAAAWPLTARTQQEIDPR